MERNPMPVSPGVCPEEKFPAPTGIECIVVDKVYDSCFQRENLPPVLACVLVDTGDFMRGQIIPCNLDKAILSCTEVERRPLENGFAELDLLFNIDNAFIQNPENPEETLPLNVAPFIKTVTLCCPEGTFIDCSESTITRCICTVSSVTTPASQPGLQVIIVCQIQLCLVIKCLARVQLLVPSYGFCVPAPCVTLQGVCPTVPPAQCF
jgi:hypothetical protein